MPYTFKHGDRPLEGVTVQRAVGRGGFGEVYYALTDSGKQVALKYLRESPEIELRGISQVMNLKSPHLITIYDVKRSPAGEWFVLMEYVGGPSLREMLLAEPGGFTPQKAAFLLAGIAKGLSYLHERGIVHRDLKPANIFYDDGYVKIGDYGLSKHMSVSRHSGQTVSVGTVHYMAPEIGSGNYTRAIDVYALGVILYEMVTGRLPFTGASMGEVLMRHLRDNPDLAGVPAAFAPVITRALAKNPDDRYASADEMLAAIMESETLERNIASFDATALTQVPRVPEAHDPDQTLTASPPRRVTVPLDAREVAAADLPPRLRARLDRMTHRLDQRAERIERKFGQFGHRMPRHRVEASAAGRTTWRQRLAFRLVVVAIAVMIGLLLSALHGIDARDFGSRTAVFALYILGGLGGVLVAYRLLPRHLLSGSWIFERLAAASLAGLLMAPAATIAYDEVDRPREPWVTVRPEPPLPPTPTLSPDADGYDREWKDYERAVRRRESSLSVAGQRPAFLARLIVAPMAAMIFCDWRRRLESGRYGTVRLGTAFWPAAVGLIAASIAGADGYHIEAAAVCAAILLLAQASTSIGGHRVTGGLPGSAAPGAAPPEDGLPSTPQAAPAVPRTLVPHRFQATGPSQPAETPADPAAAEPEVVEASRSSLAARATHGGLSFVGKVLLIMALVVFLTRWTPRGQMDIGPGWPVPPPGAAAQLWRTEALRPVIALLATGCFLLVLARSRQGWWPMVRALVGAAALFAGAIMVPSLGAPVMSLAVNGDWERLADVKPEVWGPLTGAVAVAAGGLVLLLWPARDPNRPIVIRGT